jgi:hypothetical protein
MRTFTCLTIVSHDSLAEPQERFLHDLITLSFVFAFMGVEYNCICLKEYNRNS